MASLPLAEPSMRLSMSIALTSLRKVGTSSHPSSLSTSPWLLTSDSLITSQLHRSATVIKRLLVMHALLCCAHFQVAHWWVLHSTSQYTCVDYARLALSRQRNFVTLNVRWNLLCYVKARYRWWSTGTKLQKLNYSVTYGISLNFILLHQGLTYCSNVGVSINIGLGGRRTC